MHVNADLHGGERVNGWAAGFMRSLRAAMAPAVALVAAPAVALVALVAGALPAHAQGAEPLQDPANVLLPIVRTGNPFAPRSVPAIPNGPPTDRPAATNADMNLALRGYQPTQALLELIDVGGPTDDDAPQFDALFAPPRLPAFVGAWQVYDWDWGCGPDGCRGPLLSEPPVTLLELGTDAGEFIYLPSRRADILDGIFIAMILYAEPTRLTITYTREDSPATGYTLHLEGLEVDPALVDRYAELNAAGRSSLPGLRNGDMLGRSLGTFKLAIRGAGAFLDPRTRKDWWKGY